MIITLIAVLHIKLAAMSSIVFCIAANTCFYNFLSHYNTIVSHMIKRTSLHFLYVLYVCMYKMYWITFCTEKNLLVLPKLLKMTINIINLIHVFTYCLT